LVGEIDLIQKFKMKGLLLIFWFTFILFSVNCKKVPPGYNYCVADLPLPSQPSGNLELQTVQILFRHGDRTPVNSLPPELEVQWDCSLNELYNHQKVPFPFVNPKRLFKKNYLLNRNVLPGNCLFGQLTIKGAQQHQELGLKYAEKYKSIITAANNTNIFVRSTDVPRTLASLQHDLSGWFSFVPDENADSPFDVYTMDIGLENMTPNLKTCPRLADIAINLFNSPEYKAHSQAVQPFLTALSTILRISPNYFGGNFWMAVMDIFEARRCWGMAYPPGIKDDMIDQMMDNAEWESEFPNYNNESLTLGMGPFLDEILKNFQAYIQKPGTTPRVIIFSGHDYSISVFTFLLNITDNSWPPYRSHVEMELWKDKVTQTYYIRFEYNGKERSYPGCTSRRGNLCEFNAFVNTISKFVPTDYKQQCKSRASIDYNAIRENPFRSLLDPLST